MSSAPGHSGPELGAPQPAPGDADSEASPSTEVVFHRVARSGQVPEGYIQLTVRPPATSTEQPPKSTRRCPVG